VPEAKAVDEEPTNEEERWAGGGWNVLCSFLAIGQRELP
jgi:hypothetical protein